jgi:hypothetical protein
LRRAAHIERYRLSVLRFVEVRLDAQPLFDFLTYVSFHLIEHEDGFLDPHHVDTHAATFHLERGICQRKLALICRSHAALVDLRLELGVDAVCAINVAASVRANDTDRR